MLSPKNRRKIIAINASPKMEKGNTSLILTPFIEGLQEAGAEVELFYTEKLNINSCKGDISCWVKTPGECFQDDDMKMLLPKLNQADIWVFATPLYMDGLTGPMKTLIDRICPSAQPFMELRDGHNFHVIREGVKTGKIVLVANCGFWELDNFDPILSFMKAFSRNVMREFAGALLRPHGPAMRFAKGEKMNETNAAAKEAGRQLVTKGTISSETLGAVSRELLPLDHYIQSINQGFEKIQRSRGPMD